MTGGYTYIDGIGKVRVANGMTHIDLVVVAPPAVDGQPPQIQPVQHLVMPLPQFVHMCAEMGNQLKRMEEMDFISKKAAAPPAANS